MKGFIIGFIFGIVIVLSLYFFVFLRNEEKSFKYVQLKEDYKIDDIGMLKKGTILRIDEEMSEGFTRYILYLNLKYEEVEFYETEYPDMIIPYWLQQIENNPVG